MSLKLSSRLSSYGVVFALIAILSPAVQAQEPRLTVEGMALRSMVQEDPAATPTLDKSLNLTFALKGAQIAALEAFVASQHDPTSPNYHKWLQPEEVGKRFGASDADIAAVVAFAKSYNMQVEVWPNRMFVSAETTVAQAQKAFGVTIKGYRRPQDDFAAAYSTAFYAPDRDPSLPASVANRVLDIVGLSSYLRMRPATIQRSKMVPLAPPTHSDASGVNAPVKPPVGIQPSPQFTQPLSPTQVSKVYNLDGMHKLNLDGSGQSIGIVSPTTVDDSDIRSFCTYYNLGTPTIIHTQVDGGATGNQGAGEACLDAEVILGQAPKITVVFYESPNNLNLDIWKQITKDNLPVISNSWALDEVTYHAATGGDAIVSNTDAILATMDAQGMAHYNSTGDHGSNQGPPNNTTLAVLYPSTSVHVTAVGGTSLYGDANDNYQSESAWNGGGGGLSIYFNRPSWQTGPGVVNNQSNGKRQVPDVSALADPGTPGYWVYTGGQWQQIGGTSASTPLWAVANQLLNAELVKLVGAGKRSGLLNTAIYGLGNAYSTQTGDFCYHDVTTGSNGAYSATAGWDFTTGWGSADFTKFMYDYLENYQGQAFVDLQPYTPQGATTLGTFTSPIMISKSSTTINEPTTFINTDTYYFFVAMVNFGLADTLPSKNSLQIDGVDNTFTVTPIATNWYYALSLKSGKTLTPGTHTIKLIVNSDNVIKESNTANNVFTRTITVGGVTVSLNAVSVSPTSVNGGTNATGTVTLASAAPTGGTVVTLSSSATAAATVPASVTVLAGQTSATFPVTTKAVATNTNVTLTASLNGTSKTTVLTVLAPTLSAVSLSPTSVIGGTNSTGTVTLSYAAPTGGLSVTLTSNNAAATVPASVTVAAGKTTATFPVTTTAVSANTTVTITAKAGAVSKTANLTVTASTLVGVSVSPTSVIGGTSATGTVTLSGPAPTGGATVTLTSNNAAATVPASVPVAAGQKTGTFTVKTVAVAANTAVTLTAKWGTTTSTTTLTVQASTLSSVAVNPTTVPAGQTVVGKITLTGPAPAAGTVVTLTSSLPSTASVPTSVTVPAGATTKTFLIKTGNVTADASPVITAKAGTISKTVTLTVQATKLVSLALSPSTVEGGVYTTLTATLSGPAPAGGAVVTLTNSDPTDATVPTSVTIPAGATSISVPVATNLVNANATATITGKLGTATQTATLTITP